MKTNARFVLAAGVSALLAAPALAQWVNYQEDTAARLSVASNLGADDTEEKDYAWGDLDNDGDTDLVIVRKEDFTSTGRRVNVLLMNEGGVLTDRTAEYATDSDVPGDQGFNTPTNDRDVVVVDVDGDGWLDLVTATTLTDNEAKHLSHPRVYMNLGEDAGVWQGFRHEDARIPEMHPTAGPRFCSVAAGDLTGDGAPDLYFGDYDSGGNQIFDYNNRVLVNDGSGFFSDDTTVVLPTGEMRNSAFGAASVIADIDDDGVLDVVKQTSLNAPQHVAVTYNDPADEGVMNGYDIVNAAAPYFVSAGDLNNDGLLDLVITDDNQDRYMLNAGNGGDGFADFNDVFFLLENGGMESDFGGNSWIADLDGDGWQDVIITDVDVDIPNCNTDRMHIYRNLGGQPGGTVSLREQGEVIPFADSNGVHDVAVFDIDGDGMLDMVVGRCSGTEVYMQAPVLAVGFGFPGGQPSQLTPDEPTPVQIEISVTGGAVAPDGAKMFHAVDGGPFVETTMTALGDDVYEASLPGVPCLASVEYYFRADIDGGPSFFEPADAPTEVFAVVATSGLQVLMDDEFEGDTSTWSVQNFNISGGAWEPAVPEGTINGSDLAAPFEDNTLNGSIAFVTENGPPGGAANLSDVDGGPTILQSPEFDLSGSDGVVTYARWFYTSGDDVMLVEVSGNGGGAWTIVDTVGSTNGEWETASFTVGQHITPTNHVLVRFRATDQPNNSVTEAGIDSFRMERFACGTICLADLDGGGDVGIGDLLMLLAGWGTSGPGADLAAPVDTVDIADLLALLAAWGPCE